jgi:hypothetical protein
MGIGMGLVPEGGIDMADTYTVQGDGAGICKYLDVSSGHIMEEDMYLLDFDGRARLEHEIIAVPHEYGAWIHAMQNAAQDNYNALREAGFSDAFVNVLEFARKHECVWINIDAGGVIHRDLDWCEW